MTFEEPKDPALELVLLQLGEETEAAEVDAKHGNPARSGQPAAGEKGAVPAEGKDEIRLLQTGRVRCGGRISIRAPRLDSALLEHLLRSLDHIDRRPRTEDDADVHPATGLR